jgi:hypothetical protein
MHGFRARVLGRKQFGQPPLDARGVRGEPPFEEGGPGADGLR